MSSFLDNVMTKSGREKEARFSSKDKERDKEKVKSMKA
jgi:hypothetical protein